MANSYAKAKGRRERGSFVALPHAVLLHPKFAKLSPRATKLLLDFLSQYRGNNNGEFGATYAAMRQRGWRSKSQLSKALDELRETGFVRITRQGGLHGCSKFAVTFFAIDEGKGAHDCPATRTPPGDWKK